MNDLRCAVCSLCLTLLASPDSAGGGLGRARVVSLRGVLFSFFWSKYTNVLFVRIGTYLYQSDICHVEKRRVVKK